ncbi:MAG: ribosome-associated translation inhibitor RaiA [Erysipelotrichaceae bacterium]|nr:ribosome-associated translation inhibitor RaiA [Erysipelotrichaceae bacterium]MBR5048782.1 ribosome-associated translation inhibitor RaiA [Erysipelotrichaceae bacterium]
MKVNVYAKDLSVSKDTEQTLSDKLALIEKYLLIDESTTAQAMVKRHGNDIKLEVTIPSKVGFLRSEVIDHDIRDAIDKSIEKLESQLRGQKGRLSRRHREKLAKTFIDEGGYEEEEKVKRVKRVIIEDLDSEDAIMQMELMDHNFFVYRDADTKITSVMYKREDGDYGILEIV